MTKVLLVLIHISTAPDAAVRLDAPNAKAV